MSVVTSPGPGSLPAPATWPTARPSTRRLPATRSFTVTATDVAGNSASTTVTYEVVDPSLWFGGFLWPVDAFPAVNHWPAGFPVPIRFSLNGYRGGDVLADGYPQVAEVECGAGETPEQRRAGTQRVAPRAAVSPQPRSLRLLVEDQAPLGRQLPAVPPQAR